ncbi:MAG: oxygen-independent coproporphyrinogen III oxidase [Brevundimonas sp.]|uniref:oxygen-independent coproporphyrinogen III oxidase n=1 Tax=Brevundimonas sp. TaxID=1871086 RepID=UPI00248A391E|nr:oxygen-independent coproporphyrinogen III oxidase [Brevundimonas sp.]MDI1328094.1 oxygen-independent coproporphyrinogen III oxidase [Brevundimonas sp.]
MSLRTLPPAWRSHAERNLPRYTSYPTAVAFETAAGEAEARGWLAATRADQTISAYVHVPFCKRLCWYCGCHTSVFHEYDRVRAFFQTLMLEVDLWADAMGPHAGAAHLHFGGGSPNALSPDDFRTLVRHMADRFALRPGAEVAAELDPGMLSDAFIDAAGEAGVTRASLGVQTFDPAVQKKVNRIQPFEMVAAASDRLRNAGVAAINFDLMYGLPGQTPENVAASTEAAVTLRPDRVAVFGYAHVPWMKKHQVMIREADLADGDGRWAQAEAADETLRGAGYVRIGLDHYALPDDPLAIAAEAGRLRRNFQGYTDDPAPVLVPIGPSSIGRFAEGFVQNAITTDLWGHEVEAGRLPVARRLAVDAGDELRAAVIERLMCDLAVDVGEVCRAHGFADAVLDSSIVAASRLQADGLCVVAGRTIRIPPEAHRVMRVVAACFDARLPVAASRHARAV